MRLKKKFATEECMLCDTSRTYEAQTVLDSKKYLALYGVAWQSACTDLCGGTLKYCKRGHGSDIRA